MVCRLLVPTTLSVASVKQYVFVSLHQLGVQTPKKRRTQMAHFPVRCGLTMTDTG